MAKISVNTDPRDLIQQNVTEEQIKLFSEGFDKGKPFEKQVWAPVAVLTLEQYAQYKDPRYKQVKFACIVTKRRNDNGKLFHKIEVGLATESGSIKVEEWELSYEKAKISYEEGDELDLKTLIFGKEVYDGKSHWFAAADIL